MAVSKIKDIILPNDLGCITSLLQINDDKLILAAGQKIYSVSVSSGAVKTYSEGYKYIPDMTNIDSVYFAFVDQGTWVKSTIYKMNKITGKASKFDTETYCSGITFRDGIYFVTFSNLSWWNWNKEGGNVKMIDEKGQTRQTIVRDAYQNYLFSYQISKIYVTSEHGMTLYVADIGKRSLQTIKIHSIKKTASSEEAWDSTEVNSIVCKNNRLILAVGGEKNQIVRLSNKGSKKLVEESQLNGVPKAACYVGSSLAVATTKEAGWFSPAENTIKIFLHKEEGSIASEDHVILM